MRIKSTNVNEKDALDFRIQIQFLTLNLDPFMILSEK